MHDEIEKLEVKVSYLESLNAELNEVVIAQQKEMDLLGTRMELLERKVEDLIEESGEARPNRRPPHY